MPDSLSRTRLTGLVAAVVLGVATGCVSRQPGGGHDRPEADFMDRPMLDLTHVVDASIPYWPGERYFPLKTWDLATWEEDEAFSRAYSIPEHYGTHVDAPIHFALRQPTVDALAPENLRGPAVVFDLRERVASNVDAMLTAEDVLAWEREHGRVPDGAIAFLLTGWGEKWSDPRAYRNWDGEQHLRFPSFGLSAAKLLLADRGVKGLGVDTLSVDRGLDDKFTVHRMGSGMGRWFLENVARLDEMPATGATVLVAPVPLRGGSGAQARVFAFLPLPDGTGER